MMIKPINSKTALHYDNIKTHGSVLAAKKAA